MELDCGLAKPTRHTLRGDMGIIRFLYGELSHEALVQATFFSSLLCFIVGVYWMMRSLKDSVFASVVGLEYQPQAKMFSLVVVSVVLVAYNKIVDIVPRHRLFAVICGAYSALFVATAVMLTSTTHGLVGPDGQPIPPSPERWLGWIHYFAIESYGSLVVSLFWQYLNSQVNLKEATAAARPPDRPPRRVGVSPPLTPTRPHAAGQGPVRPHHRRRPSEPRPTAPPSTLGPTAHRPPRLSGQIGAITGCTLVVGSKRFGVPQLYGAGRPSFGSSCRRRRVPASPRPRRPWHSTSRADVIRSLRRAGLPRLAADRPDVPLPLPARRVHQRLLPQAPSPQTLPRHFLDTS